MVLCLDTLDDPASRERVLDMVKKRCHCPIVSIREGLDGANNLLVQNTTCMEVMVRHFIEHHGFKNLCFLTGHKGRWDAEERLACFEKVMKEYDLPVNEHQKFYGNFWYGVEEQACDWFLEGDEKPEAIICANDVMAMAMSGELIRRGYHIPEDIAISGYDGLSDTISFTPTVTTMKVPFFDMGKKAVEIIHEKQNCPEQVEDYFFDVDLILHESCGCKEHNQKEILLKKRDLLQEERDAKNREVQFNYMSISLGNCSDIDDMKECLSYYQYDIDGLSNYAICVCDNLYEREDYTGYTAQMVLRLAMKNRQSLENINIRFNKEELVPDILCGEEAQIWCFAPLHFQDDCYGYEAMNFSNPKQLGNMFFRWNISIGNQIHDILIEHKMQRLILELEEMYDWDALTGMYNRRGWENHGKGMFASAKEAENTIFLAVIDLDGMKQINDNYGHEEGDFALKKVKEAITSACTNSCISARTGGDEFVVMQKAITTEEANNLLKRVENYLEEFNSSDEKAYDIHASVGFICRVPKGDETMETYMKESDAVMYQNKVINKVRRGEPLR